MTGTDEEPELCLGDRASLSEVAVAEPRETRAHSSAGRGSVGVAVARQRGREGAVDVAGGDGVQELLVTVARRHHSYRNSHRGTSSRQGGGAQHRSTTSICQSRGGSSGDLLPEVNHLSARIQARRIRRG